MLEPTNEVLLEGFLSEKKLREASDKITSKAALLKFEFIRVIVSSEGCDHVAVVNFVEAMKVIPIKFRVEIEKAGSGGEYIALALNKKR
jgi:hypothetical protein